MIVYWAPGAGLGHITRARAVLHTLHPGVVARIVTSCRFAPHPDLTGDHEVVRVNAHDKATLAKARADVLRAGCALVYIDAFYAGISGEWADGHPERVPLVHVARRLRLNAYDEVVGASPPPHFVRTHVLEALEPAHMRLLERISDEVCNVTLEDPVTPPAIADQPVAQWLVVHAGPAQECAELVRRAEQDATAAPGPVNIVIEAPALTRAPVRFFAMRPGYARVYSGAGFNACRQARALSIPHWTTPFARRFDDQHWRHDQTVRSERERRAHAA